MTEAEDDSSTPQTPFTLRESPNRRIGIDATLTARIGLFRATLVGGFFDDPTILLQQIQGERCMLFDLGEVQRYPTKVLNRVTDVFVTHAHTDHFAGFVRLLRTRVHGGERCRLFGPPKLAERVESLVRGFTWDRLEPEEGPVFEVGELHGDRLRRFEIRATRPGPQPLEARDAEEGLLFDEPRFRVRACELDHGTPVLAYTVEEHENYSVRSDRLEPPYEPGPWLADLKRHVARGDTDATLELPDGSTERIESLAKRLLIVRPGEKFTYATDFADTDRNRRRIEELARDSDVLVCEAFYADDDADVADAYGHLTTSACAEIAATAAVDQLVPFHFSARYDHEPERLYREILETFDDVLVPRAIEERLEDAD